MSARLLLVDDHRENLLALEAVLRDLGHELVTAGSGREALRQVLEKDFALILMDVQMPEMDGFETAEVIRSRERSRDTPIIFLTAYSTSEEFVYKGYSRGAVDYIFKPVSAEILKAKVSVFVDLFQKTEQVRAQARELARSNAELEQFAYVVSHDLRAPLRHITGFLEMLERASRDKLGEEGRDYLRRAVGGAARLDRMISDLLVYARAGAPERPAARVRASQALESALEILKPQLAETGAAVSRDPLPEVLIDPGQLARVFQNLIGNALKFHGDEPPRVHVSASREEGEWVFAVRDNGIGIDAEHQAQVFTLFKRLHSGDRYPGTGIGLAICKKIVESNHGRIWLRSAAGAGSTFFFTLPAGASAAKA